LNEALCEGFVLEISGCTNANATNYNPLATIDDGSCIVPGCMYPQALNYNATATFDNLSCIFPEEQNCASDLNNDGVVNISDLLLFMADFGGVCE